MRALLSSEIRPMMSFVVREDRKQLQGAPAADEAEKIDTSARCALALGDVGYRQLPALLGTY